MTTTNAGNFTAGGLRVGGPYTVRVSSPQHADQTITDVMVQLGSAYSFAVTLGDVTMEEVTVTAIAARGAPVAIGPATGFSLDDLENAPAVNRDINDLIRIDPRIYIDEADVDGIQCNGASSRYNSLTVDGIKLNDNFGLNRNGYPTQRMPFPYDAIQQVAVELAPFDVQYGGFTACNINAVTKSGTNEFHGSVFFDYTSDDFIGGGLEDTIIPPGDFNEKRYGFAIGGPIIKDKLFFFAAYQNDETSDSFDRCGADEACGRPVEGVTAAQLARIDTIMRNVYNYDPGARITNAPVEDEKYLIKLDWNVNDQHRANLTYNFNDGVNLTTSDGDDDEYEFSNHFYQRGAELNAYSANLFSDWNDNFSTEVRIGHAKLDNSQVTRNGVGFPEFRIETYADVDGDGIFSRANVFVGGDDSRQSNKLDYKSTTFKLAGSYSLDNHVISGGFEREALDVANLFLQHSIGEYRFDEQCSPAQPDLCIDKVEALSPDDIYYGNAAGTNNPQDAAGALKYEINTLYVQDEMSLRGDDLQLVFGLRYDWYTSDDLPTANANFMARNGFTNATNFDGEGLIQPRFGFNWDLTEDVSVRGGIGLYSGGNPNVWLTNNYQVDGVTQIQAREFNVGLSDLNGPNLMDARFLGAPTVPLSGAGRPGYDIPQAFVDFVATGTANSSVNAMAPDFEIPSQWKFALGGTYRFDLPGIWGSDYTLSGDILLTKGQDSAIIRDATLAQVDTAPDGRPIYRSIDRSDPDCVNPTAANCSSRNFNQDFILGNVSGGDSKQTAVSFSLSKEYDNGFDWTFGYSYVEAEDVSPMTSSVAFSNFANNAVSDANNPGRAISNYQIPQRFILKAGYRKAFWRDLDTRVTVFGSANEGRPYSYSFTNDDGDIFGDRIDRRHLLYMPTGAMDPRVRFDPGFDQAAFFAFADRAGLSGYGGQIVPRNEFDSGWWTKFDVRLSQELPGFREGQKASAFIVIENIGNLFNDEWGVLKEVGFPRIEDIVDADYDAAANQYIFQNFNAPGGERRSTGASLWEIRLGVKYSF
ncbi:MAG: TonB-dependent receptor [Gammaproteobacteria bacterium]|nr:TonB-dependent receptor [Gammaproteobacteria bacterium]